MNMTMERNRFSRTAIAVALMALGLTARAQDAPSAPNRFTNCLNIATPNAATLSVRKATTKENQPLKAGDEVAVFDDFGTCMGATVWKTDKGNALRAQGADALFSIPGLSVGDSMRFRIWDATLEREFHAEPTWISPEQHSGKFVAGSFFIIELETSEPLPVELVRFSGYARGPVVVLEWETASESGNAGFEVQHSLDRTDFELLGFVPGTGSATEARSYEYRTPVMPEGLHYFRLRQIDFDGRSTTSPVIEVYRALGDPAVLSPAFPNPTGSKMSWSMAVERSEEVRVDVFDLRGRKVASAFEGTLLGGESRKADFDAGALPAGLYVLVLETASGFRSTRTLTVAR